MPRRRLLDAAVRAGGAFLGGGAIYAAWLALFLALTKLDNFLIARLLWVAAPIATGVGCAVGAWAGAHLRHTELSIWDVWPWSVTGCVIGALTVFWYGPMLIVFTMLAGGTVAVALREVASSPAPPPEPPSFGGG